MLIYAHWAHSGVASEVGAHVRAHLSSVASEDDSPDRYAAEVDISAVAHDRGILITGRLDREPVADYLRPDFDPEQDVEANPLTVPSIEEDR